jgi:hypothetical protein
LVKSSAIATAEGKAANLLVVSAEDFAEMPVLEQTCARYALNMQGAQAGDATQLLEQQKFEGIMVDFGLGADGETFLEAVHRSRANRTAITFALVQGREQSAAASRLGSAFILQRPISDESLSGTMKVAFGLIMRERRRYFRCDTAIPVTVQMDDGASLACNTVNLSEGGLAIATEIALPAGLSGTIRLQLSDPDVDFACQVRVCWATENGKAGLNFVSLAPALASQLQAWLWIRLERTLPAAVLAKFREQRA